MNDDLVRPEGGGRFPVLALEGLYVLLQDLGVAARSIHSVLLRDDVLDIVARDQVGRTSENTTISRQLGEERSLPPLRAASLRRASSRLLLWRRLAPRRYERSASPSRLCRATTLPFAPW